MKVSTNFKNADEIYFEGLKTGITLNKIPK